jgi:hypothetical protein
MFLVRWSRSAKDELTRLWVDSPSDVRSEITTHENFPCRTTRIDEWTISFD